MSFISYNEHISGSRFENETDGVVYRHTHDVHSFLRNEVINLNKSIVLVTHNSDNSVTNEMVSLLQHLPNISMWFGQNISCSPHPKITSLPIGLENDHWFPEVAKRKQLLKFAHKNVMPSKLMYMNFSFGTNVSARRVAYNEFADKKWVTDSCVHSVVQSAYTLWLKDVLNHHYVLCPRGNGIDTHRLWETLYLGRIPVVLRCENMSYYDKLPILQVDSWNQVTQQLLEDRLFFFSQASNFDLAMLKMSWWSNKIHSAKKHTQ